MKSLEELQQESDQKWGLQEKENQRIEALRNAGVRQQGSSGGSAGCGLNVDKTPMSIWIWSEEPQADLTPEQARKFGQALISLANIADIENGVTP